MPVPVLATKLYLPPIRTNLVSRSRLIERLNQGTHQKLTLISAPAGFGKTMLVSEWVTQCKRPVAWLSLDEGDSDPIRFLTYLVAALQTIAPKIGKGILEALGSSPPPPVDAVQTALLNEITTIPDQFVLVLDDYHLIDSKPVDDVLDFLVEHLPPQTHLVMATREDPQLPLARLRARNELTEIRFADLSFTPPEAAEFLNHGMGLALTAEDVGGLVSRTEGWIAGLQLAAVSMQGRADPASFIQSFTGSNRFVLDYLLEDVLQQQPERVQEFLLCTSILERLCDELCEAVLCTPSGSAQEILEHLERANLFIVPLDDARHWYRYHHLFADLLRQRLQLRQPGGTADLHIRASVWYEEHGFDMEAFQHAVSANDIEGATRLVQGNGMPLHIRGGLVPVLNWLESLPAKVLDEHPVLWIMFAGALTTAGQTTGVEQKLQAAEAALHGVPLDLETRDLIGRIANNRATLAITRYEPDETIAQAQRALEYLRPDNLPVRAITTWTLAVAYQFKGERSKATRAFTEVISTSQAIGQTFVTKLATSGLGNLQEADNKLHLAAQTYQHTLELFGDQPLLFATEAHLGLARISYEWNDLDAAQRLGRQALHLARQYPDTIDRYILCELFLARVLLASGDISGAAAIVKKADQSTREHNFAQRIPDVAAAQVVTLLRQGYLDEAAALAQAHKIPFSQARVYLAQGEAAKALEVLVSLRDQLHARDWKDELLKVVVLQAVVYEALGEREQALQAMREALAVTEEDGFIRIFIDEGELMAQLLSAAAARGIAPNYVRKLLAEFTTVHRDEGKSALTPSRTLIEPLSPRELEVLRLIAQGLPNREIGQRLFLALDTVKGHNRIIFDKLQVQSRTEAVARARELGLL